MIEIFCECGNLVEVEFKKQLGIFIGICSNKECQLEQRMKVTELETSKNYFESTTTEPKKCKNCDKIWVTKHTCKSGDKYSQQKQIYDLMLLSQEENRE